MLAGFLRMAALLLRSMSMAGTWLEEMVWEICERLYKLIRDFKIKMISNDT